MGFEPEAFAGAYAELVACPFVRDLVLMWHFARADEPEHDDTEQQAHFHGSRTLRGSPHGSTSRWDARQARSASGSPRRPLRRRTVPAPRLPWPSRAPALPTSTATAQRLGRGKLQAHPDRLEIRAGACDGRRMARRHKQAHAVACADLKGPLNIVLFGGLARRLLDHPIGDQPHRRVRVAVTGADGNRTRRALAQETHGIVDLRQAVVESDQWPRRTHAGISGSAA